MAHSLDGNQRSWRTIKLYANTYFWLFEMHDGKVTKASAMFDFIEFNDFWSRAKQ